MKFASKIALAAAIVAFAFSTSVAHAGGKKKSIAGLAVGTKSLSTLVVAVKKAGLVKVLAKKGPFTVFAPTNDAFKKIPAEKLKAILKNKKLLTKILTYHVVPGTVTAKQVVKLSEATTVQGEKISIEVKDGKVVLNGNSTVVATDIEARNGVVHVIDTVILPPSLTKD
ncbi:MAG: fasciclin domain-containing protein [Gemmataceae bacterium]